MADFQPTIVYAGFTPPDHIAPGIYYRYPGLNKKPSNRAGWCLLFDDLKAGVYGDFSSGIKWTWFDGNSRDLTLDERLKLRQQIRIAQGHRKADLEILRHDTAKEARILWESGSENIIHPYPVNKQIIPYGARQKDNALLIPMYYLNAIWNIQRIYPDGKKYFMKCGRVIGAYMPIGAISDHIYICEGYATGCSLHEHTGAPVAVAFNAGNLKSVAICIRKKYPGIEITVAADNDTATPGNPGLTKGRAAAAAVDGDVIYPDFSDEDFTGTDYNDYLTQGGEL